MNGMAHSSATMIILSGNREQVQQQLQKLFPMVSVDTISLDEKSIIKVRKLLLLVRPELKHNVLCFGCKDLALQRYQFVLKSYLLLARARQRLIIDENGLTNKFTVVGYFLSDVPRFLLEVVASAGVVAFAYVRLVLLRTALGKGHRRENIIRQGPISNEK